MKKWTAHTKFYLTYLEPQIIGSKSICVIEIGEILYESPSSEYNMISIKGTWYNLDFPDVWKPYCTDGGVLTSEEANALLASGSTGFSGTQTVQTDTFDDATGIKKVTKQFVISNGTVRSISVAQETLIVATGPCPEV